MKNVELSSINRNYVGDDVYIQNEEKNCIYVPVFTNNFVKFSMFVVLVNMLLFLSNFCFDYYIFSFIFCFHLQCRRLFLSQFLRSILYFLEMKMALPFMFYRTVNSKAYSYIIKKLEEKNYMYTIYICSISLPTNQLMNSSFFFSLVRCFYFCIATLIMLPVECKKTEFLSTFHLLFLNCEFIVFAGRLSRIYYTYSPL